MHTSTELANVHAEMYEEHTTLKSVVAHYVTDDHTALWKTKIHCFWRVMDIYLHGTQLRRLQRFYHSLRCSVVSENQYGKNSTPSDSDCITVPSLDSRKMRSVRDHNCTEEVTGTNSVRESSNLFYKQILADVKYITSISNIHSVVSVKTQK